MGLMRRRGGVKGNDYFFRGSRSMSIRHSFI